MIFTSYFSLYMSLFPVVFITFLLYCLHKVQQTIHTQNSCGVEFVTGMNRRFTSIFLNFTAYCSCRRKIPSRYRGKIQKCCGNRAIYSERSNDEPKFTTELLCVSTGILSFDASAPAKSRRFNTHDTNVLHFRK